MQTNTTTPRTFRGLTAIALALAALGLSQPAAQAAATTLLVDYRSSGDVAATAADFQAHDANVDPGATVNNVSGAGTITPGVFGSGTVVTNNPSDGGFWQGGGTYDNQPILEGYMYGRTTNKTVTVSGLATVPSGQTFTLTLYGVGNSTGQSTTFTPTYGSSLGAKTTVYGTTPIEQWTFVSNGTTDTLTINWVKGGTAPDGAFNGFSLTAIAPRVVSAADSTVTASPTTVASDGITASTITVTLKDSTSAPVDGRTVTLASDRPSTDTILPASGVSNGSGVVTFSVKSATSGAAVLTATDTSDSPNVVVTQTATVTFISDAVSAANSTVTADPTTVAADGTTTSTITVTLKNADSNPLSGKAVTLAKTSGPGSPTITTIAGTTDGSGVATFTVKSTTAGADVFTATETEDSVVIAQTATVTFTVGGVSAGTSTVVAAPAIVPADGIAVSTVTITLLDSNSNPVADKTVTLVSSRLADDAISAASGLSSASGVVTFTVKSATPGDSVFTATGDSVALGTTPGVTFTAVSAADSTVAASPSSVIADGSAMSTITVTLKDASGNPFAGKTVTLAHTSGPGTPVITTVSGTTSASGVATFTVNSVTVGVDVFTATGDSVILTPTATVTFTAVPAIITWGSATDDTDLATDVLVNGTFVDAVTTYGSDVTLNGVTFQHYSSHTGSGPYSLAFGTSGISMTYPASNLTFESNPATTDYEKLLHNSMYADHGSGTITLSNLTPGTQYQVQVWAPDWNGFVSNVFDGQVTVLGRNYSQSLQSQYAVGTFTANSSTQVIPFTAGATGGYYSYAPAAVSLRALSGGPVADYTTWLSEYTFAEGADTTPTGDADGDGLNNQQEYAFGLDPTKGSSVNPCSPLLGTQFSYTRRATSGLAYVVEYSTDLATWNPASVTESLGDSDPNGVQIVTVTVSNAPVDGKLFVRVQAQ